MASIAELFKKGRERKGWSLRELARQSGIPVSTISKLEAGELKNPTYSTIVCLANHLGFTDRQFAALFRD